MDDCYLEIHRPVKIESKVKGSRFIGESRRVRSEQEIETELDGIRRREFNASHHCYAWKLGLTQHSRFKYSDDGEPSGTAGKPIYDIIDGNEVTNVLLVVTRYFGGTKLGTGGLARAYADTARKALQKSGVTECFVTEKIRLALEFPVYDRLQKLLKRLQARVVDSDFTDTVRLLVEVRQSRADELISSFIELTSGRGTFEKITAT
jgi:uncharacterized YigZ family protein